MRGLGIKPRLITKRLKSFISGTMSAKGFSKAVLGLSGGLDSAVTAYLCVAALGKDNITGIIMPYARSFSDSVYHAEKIARILKIKTELVDIRPMVDAYFKKDKSTDNLRRGNKMARERMSILYDLSRRYNALVIGTSNRTEILLGYGTIHGDCACALNPIGGLYKTQLRVLAQYLGVPSYIINKPPSAGLWHGQTDEGEIGYAYSKIDELLFFMIDKKMNDKRLIAKGFDETFIRYIRDRIRKNTFKSRPPVIAKI
jgi:NAD+ synthase